MTSYLIRRVLLMIPTFVGVSFAIWLVMALAPGETVKPGAGGDFGGDPTQNLKDLETQSKNVRMFRKQFNLDRPLFWNSWTGLEKNEVREALDTVMAGVQARGAGPVGKAKRRLDDWGHYAIPGLVEIVGETEGALQSYALATLRKSAYTFRTIRAAGAQLSEEEAARDRRIDAENDRINGRDLSWGPEDPPERRREVASAWRRWLEEKRAADGSWDYGTGEKIWYGLTDTQFGGYWGKLLKGDLGLSSREQKPVLGMILGRLKYSLTMVLPSFLIAWVLAVFFGVTCAVNHGTWLDHGIGMSLFVLYSIPAVVAGTVLQRLLAVDWGWFPTSGFDSGSAAKALDTWSYFGDVIVHVALPIVCYTYGSMAYISRQARSGMLEVLRSDYVRTAEAKGLPRRTVIWRHAVRNGMMPIVTLLGTALPVLLGGSVVIEYIFNIDGFGLLMINSILQKDFNVVMGVELIVAALTLVGMLITDLTYAAMDPRISYR